MSDKELVTDKTIVRKLTIVFVIAYLAQGIGGQFGIIAQPVQFFMKEGPASDRGAGVCIPRHSDDGRGVFKPFYGILCDCIPLFGYRRKSYIVASNLLAGAALLTLAFSNDLTIIRTALVVLAIAWQLVAQSQSA